MTISLVATTMEYASLLTIILSSLAPVCFSPLSAAFAGGSALGHDICGGVGNTAGPTKDLWGGPSSTRKLFECYVSGPIWTDHIFTKVSWFT